MDLRERTLAYIQKHGTPKAVLARRIGVSLSHLFFYLRGERTMSEKRLKLLEKEISQ